MLIAFQFVDRNLPITGLDVGFSHARGYLHARICFIYVA